VFCTDGGLAKSAICEGGHQQTMNHRVDTYPLMKFADKLQSVQNVEDGNYIGA